MGKLRPGAAVVVAFLAVSVALTLNHPNHKARFLHTWLPVAYVLAGVGLAVAARAAGRFAPAATAAGVLAVVAVFGPDARGPGHATDRHDFPSGASLLDLTDTYLPDLDRGTKPLVLSNVCAPLWVKWSAIDRWGEAGRVETDFRSIGWFDPVTPEVFQLWLQSMTTDTVVFIDVPPGSDLYEAPPPIEANPLAEEILKGQSVFRMEKEVVVPNRGRVIVWRR
jgi:hypothetical protein